MKKRLKKKRAKRNWYYAAKIMSLIFHRPIEIDYNTPITKDVLENLNDAQVRKIIKRIKELE